MDVSIEMVIAPKVAEGVKPPLEPNPSEPGRDTPTHHGVSPWTWTAFGVGAAALGGALAFELMRSSAEDDVRNEQTESLATTPTTACRAGRRRRASSRELAAQPSWSAACSCFSTCEATGAPPRQVGLGCQGGSCGAVVRGRF